MSTLIIGATSRIALATARELASAGDRLYLVARDADALDRLARDLRTRGAQVDIAVHDVNDTASQDSMLETAWSTLGRVDTVLIAHGTLPDQAACERDIPRALAEFTTNAVAGLGLALDIANRLERQGEGTLAMITSVAGERGRQSNYLYGAAKAAVSRLLEGLAHRFSGSGVRVLDIRPGLVDTPMTANFPKGPLWASAEQVGGRIANLLQVGAEGVRYVPRRWFWIMLIIRSLPRALLHRTRL